MGSLQPDAVQGQQSPVDPAGYLMIEAEVMPAPFQSNAPLAAPVEAHQERPDRSIPAFLASHQGQNLIGGIAITLTVILTFLIRPYSIGLYFYYFALWGAFIYFAHRKVFRDFATAYFLNSLAIAVFFLIQTQVYPESYGTTSPLGSWTDDSFFFALAADEVPSTLELRDSYYLYSQTFSSIVRWLTLPPTSHPMDLIFFQSGIAALLATFTKRFMWQMSADRKLANTVYVLAVTCPFLMMNGGVIFIRDTLVAALLIYTLACLFDRRFILAAIAVGLEILIRPGTGVILLPAIAIIYLSGGKKLLSKGNLAVAALCMPIAAFALVRISALRELLPGGDAIAQLSLTGREVWTDLRADAGSNAIFLALQEQTFLVKFILNGAYMFAYPFLNLTGSFATPYFDVRTVVMGLVVPIYAFWLNAWFIAGALTRVKAMDRQRQVIYAFAITLLILGTYSLQTRHKTIVYPLYFLVIAVGMIRAKPTERQIGYFASFVLVAIQVLVTAVL